MFPKNTSKKVFFLFVRDGHHQSVSHIELVNDWVTLWQGTRNDGVCDKKSFVLVPPTQRSSLKNTPLQFCRKQIAANMRRLVWSLCDLQSQWRRQEEEEEDSRSQKCSLLQKKAFYNRNQPVHHSHHQHRHFDYDHQRTFINNFFHHCRHSQEPSCSVTSGTSSSSWSPWSLCLWSFDDLYHCVHHYNHHDQ